MIDQLQSKVRTYKKQIEEAEEIAALNLAKFRQTQVRRGLKKLTFKADKVARSLSPLPSPLGFNGQIRLFLHVLIYKVKRFLMVRPQKYIHMFLKRERPKMNNFGRQNKCMGVDKNTFQY